ncbi:MAG: DUF2490 domain-containing protein [Tannerellaceae bacterium]|jgi:hypothetical protein|nr:DUF2490 domain-containing protein [Tannerellaceae bacterium]
MNIKNGLLALILFIPTFWMAAQSSSDWSLRTNAGVEFKVAKKWEAGMEIEYRRKENMSLTDQIRGGADMNYILNKYIKLGVGYELIADKKKKKDIFAWRNRFMMNVSFTYKYRGFTIGWRPRMQTTLMSDLESNDYYTDNYRWVSRNRFSLKYNIPHSPLNPYVRFEVFNHLFNEMKPLLYKKRISTGIEYKINKRHIFSLGYINENETFQAQTYKANIIQAGWMFSF